MAPTTKTFVSLIAAMSKGGDDALDVVVLVPLPSCFFFLLPLFLCFRRPSLYGSCITLCRLRIYPFGPLGVTSSAACVYAGHQVGGRGRDQALGHLLCGHGCV